MVVERGREAGGARVVRGLDVVVLWKGVGGGSLVGCCEGLAMFNVVNMTWKRKTEFPMNIWDENATYSKK